MLGQQLALREISVELNLQPDLPKILADKDRLEQIFLNLITLLLSFPVYREAQHGVQGAAPDGR